MGIEAARQRSKQQLDITRQSKPLPAALLRQPIANPPAVRAHWHHHLSLLIFSLGVLLPVTDIRAAQQALPGSDKTPIYFTADELVFERNERLVIARGHVEIVRENRVLTADEVRYDRDTDLAVATGHVTLSQQDGNVVFADRFELTGDLKQGFAERLRMLLADDSRLAAVSGERMDGAVTTLNRAVYSPCDLCIDDPEAPPLWQIRAERVVHDEQTKDVIYRDATVEFFGVPVFYTPYFSHPDPTVFQRTGLLSVYGGADNDLGSYAAGQYYFAIDESLDATVNAMITTKQGPLLGGEVRKRFDFGDLEFSANISPSDRHTGTGAGLRSVDETLRGNIEGRGRFDISQNWRGGFDLDLATDDTFLREFNISDVDTLENRGFLEYFNNRDYASVEAYYFQDQRPGVTGDEPIVAPYAQWQMLGDPKGLYGGRWQADLGVRTITRNDGADNLRLSGQLGWQRRMIADFGLVTDIDLSLRSDTYVEHDLLRDPTVISTSNSHTETRLLPQAQLTLGYPLVRQAWGLQQTIEPMLSFITAPEIDTAQSDISNEDSTTIEFNFANLFDTNRFPGDDRHESGTRVIYGARFALEGEPGIAKLFLGQSHRLTQDTTLPQNSGLEDRTSDVVGGIRLTAYGLGDANYLFRVNPGDFSSGRHELSFNTQIADINLGGTYLFAEGIAGSDFPEDRQQLFMAASTALDDHWSTGIYHRRDLGSESGALATGLQLIYQDECFLFSINATRDYTIRDGLEQGDSIFFRIGLKNLGEFQTPSFGLDFGGNDS